jgi:hypothetical protein
MKMPGRHLVKVGFQGGVLYLCDAHRLDRSLQVFWVPYMSEVGRIGLEQA